MTAFVLLHGFAQTPRSWNTVAAALQAAGHRTFVLDLYGAPLAAPSARDGLCSGAVAGSGDAPTSSPKTAASPSSLASRDSLASLAAVCDRVVATVGMVAEAEGAPVLVGYSMGGRIAAETLVRNPDLPLAALVLESAGLGPAGAATRAAAAERSAEWAARLRREGVVPFMDWWETLPLFASQRALPTETRAAVRADREAHGADALARSLEAWGAQHQADEADTLAALRTLGERGVPVLYLAGARDEKYAALAERVRQAGLPATLVSEAGHNVHLEQPAAYLRALASALA